ncbi:sensor domain-containing diguanylate cyclase/phosphohydrolase [Novipirellula artificiosorum]|uniref:diguanylate cyclase n=1 Tax=Novipirellula artificiosorum TaxID=2528016 RepID=A0A5C6D9V8_9BACT|nr:diguanylate cyclase [Novipirellula artificiosorum]TWU32955.1 putative diguanylate cyclase YdaM [Novipirellula artificiosorum]
MTEILAPTVAFAPTAVVGPSASSLEDSQGNENQISRLLEGLREAAPAAEENPNAKSVDLKFENRLAMVRLGIATSLFYSLRAKHVATAAHSLRVALSCSTWAHRLGLQESQRDRIEVAALLHDLGKIGIPDRILRKPGKLTVEEQLTMDCCSRLGCEILRGCTDDAELLDIVLHANTWFDSRRYEDGPRHDALPLGSRMLAIADAFDAMTTDHVYRSAMSRERAVQELSQSSGTQFDPELVIDFSRMLEDRPEMLHGIVADRWLKQLQGDPNTSLWTSTTNDFNEAINPNAKSESYFLNHLTGKLRDGVAFTDNEGTITRWNDAMRRVTSIAADAMLGKSWCDESIRLRERDASRQENACVVFECLRTGASVCRGMLLEKPGSSPVPVHVQVSPVISDSGTSFGSVIVIRDLSDQASLEEKVESLHHQTTRDSLTGIYNRSYFDDQLAASTKRTAEGGETFSLIICDIDHFKRVNDVHGHPAGDEALIRFASILESHSREADVVARYGGEEFLLIAANCDNATATKRAEVIRAALEQTPLPSLGGEPVTASFGVTEFQAGDSPETILARADRALLKAKDNGRNRVIQLGAGNCPSLRAETPKRGWFGFFDHGVSRQNSEVDILTPVPVDLAIEKLRGFIADHDAEIIRVTENQVSLKVNAVCTTSGRRRIDHYITLDAQLTLSEQQRNDRSGMPSRKWHGTKVHVVVRPIRNRDRRSRALHPCIAQLIASLKSYLMGEVIKDVAP